MGSKALRRFEDSMNIGYEQWHDGIGYDLEAIDQLTESERRAAEKKLIPRADQDWRDLEALSRLGTGPAIEAIIRVRQSSDPQIRLTAHQYGPEPTTKEWEKAILGALESAQIYAGLTSALSCAIDYPTEAVIEKLWAKVRDPESGVAYHCASTLCSIKGILSSPYDDKYRPLFLRLVGPASDDRSKAVQELELLLGK